MNSAAPLWVFATCLFSRSCIITGSWLFIMAEYIMSDSASAERRFFKLFFTSIVTHAAIRIIIATNPHL